MQHKLRMSRWPHILAAGSLSDRGNDWQSQAQLRVPLSDVTTTQIEVLSVFPVVLEPKAAQ